MLSVEEREKKNYLRVFRFILLAYGVKLANCLNVCIDNGLAICLNPTCKIVLGSCNTPDGDLHLTEVREVLFRPLGSYIRGNVLHNINSYRMMYMEMLEMNSMPGPRFRLNIPQHVFGPLESVAAFEDNIYQTSARVDEVRESPCQPAADAAVTAPARVRDFASYQLFGKNQNVLGRLVLGHPESRKTPTAMTVIPRSSISENVEKTSVVVKSEPQPSTSSDGDRAGKVSLRCISTYKCERFCHFPLFNFPFYFVISFA